MFRLFPPRALAPVALAASLSLPLPAHAQLNSPQDETRDRVLLIHQSRGTLAPGTRPKCFSANHDDRVAGAQFQCPWDPPNGQRQMPTARSFFGLFGNY